MGLRTELAKLIQSNLGKTEEEQKKRVVDFLKEWEKQAGQLKTTIEKAVPEFVPKPERKIVTTETGKKKVIAPKTTIPQKVGFAAAAPLTTAARTGVELIPAEPSELATLAAFSVLGPIVGRGIGAGAQKIAPKAVSRLSALAKKPISLGVRRALPAARINLAPGAAIQPIRKPVTETGRVLLAIQFPKGIPKGEIFDPKLATQQIKNVVTSAAKGSKTGKGTEILTNQNKRIFRRILDAFEANEIEVPKNLPQILKQHNLSQIQFAQIFVDTISTAGRDLNVLSKASKEFGKFLTPEANKILARMSLAARTPWQKFTTFYKALDNRRRALLVTQLATAMRNLISQGLRYGLQIVDDIVAGTLRIALKGQRPGIAYRDALEDVLAVCRRFSPKARTKLNEILNNNLLQKTRLESNIMGDLTITGKTLKLLNSANILQETLFRKLATDARVNSRLFAQGKNMFNASADDIARVLPGAVDHALEMTFAADPAKGTLLKSLLNVYKDVPIMTALGNPFPRFWANSMKFLVDYSPFGYTRLFSPQAIQQMASGNMNVATNAISKAVIGTIMWTGAFAMRNSKFAGEKWYEVKKFENGKDTGKRIDLRAFAPFSTYLFIAEAMKDQAGEKTTLTPTDYLQGIVSINRIAGTGLVLVDLLRTENPFKLKQTIKDFAGQLLGGFSVPARTWTDLIGGVNLEERIARTPRLNPLTGPFLQNIPGALRQLPKAHSIFREKPFEREQTILRQTTGLTIKTKSPIEKEVSRLGMSFGDLAPSTGDRKLDLEATKIMGKMTEKPLNKFVKGEEYKDMSDFMKAAILRRMIQRFRTASIKAAKGQDVTKAMLFDIKARDPIEQKIALEAFLKSGIVTRKEILETGINLKKLEIK